MAQNPHTIDRPPTRAPWPVVGVAAWAVPGLGHALIGEGRRGVVVGVALLGLFMMGLLIGGIDAVDRQRDTLWFAGQVLIGPAALATDAVHQKLEADRTAAIRDYGDRHNLSHHDALREMIRSGVPLPYRTPVNRPNEYGTLYCAIAGVMNLLAILDAVGRAAAGRGPRSQVPGPRSQVSGLKSHDGTPARP